VVEVAGRLVRMNQQDQVEFWRHGS
jgi:hypothetical protein